MEYEWLREEARNERLLNKYKSGPGILSWIIRDRISDHREKEIVDYRVRLDGMSRVGLVLQALGMILLFIALVSEWDLTTTFSFATVVAGEIIIINSLCHHGCELRGERIE
jgi:hypothetical protein